MPFLITDMIDFVERANNKTVTFKNASQFVAWVGDPRFLLHQLSRVNTDIISLDAYI